MTELSKGILLMVIPCGIIIGYLLIKLDQIKWERDYAEIGYKIITQKYEELREEHHENYY